MISIGTGMQSRFYIERMVLTFTCLMATLGFSLGADELDSAWDTFEISSVPERPVADKANSQHFQENTGVAVREAEEPRSQNAVPSRRHEAKEESQWFQFEVAEQENSDIEPSQDQQSMPVVSKQPVATESLNDEKLVGSWFGLDEGGASVSYDEPNPYQQTAPIKESRKSREQWPQDREDLAVHRQGDESPLRSGEIQPLPSRQEILKRLEERKQQVQPVFTSTGDYRLRVGDTLRISIYGELNTERVITIDAHGEVSYLLVGRMQAAGFTIDEFTKRINEDMRTHLQFGLVNVVPVEFGGLSYTVLGQVRDPGKKALMGRTTVLDALAAANGMSVGFFRSQTQDLADLHHAFLARRGEYIPVDFWRLVVEGDMRENVELEDGDYIFVPSSLSRNIFVIGEVHLPANIGYQNRETLAGALAKARGITREADRYAFIVRGSLSEPRATRVNLSDLHNGRIRDVLLKPGDIVYVPRRSTMFVEDVIYAALRSFVSGFFNVAGRESFIRLEPDAADSDFGGKVFFP